MTLPPPLEISLAQIVRLLTQRHRGKKMVQKVIPQTAFHQRLATPVTLNIEGLDVIQKSVYRLTEQATHLATQVQLIPSQVVMPIQSQIAQIQPTIVKEIDTKLNTNFAAADKQFNNLQIILGQILHAVNPSPETDLETVSECCIEDAFEFWRTLNQIEDLIIDSAFCEPDKDNNQQLDEYKYTQLYSDCIAILDRKCDSGQLTPEDKYKFEQEFNNLFESISDDLKKRTQRWLKIHSFRQKIADFFLSEKCQDKAIITSEGEV